MRRTSAGGVYKRLYTPPVVYVRICGYLCGYFEVYTTGLHIAQYFRGAQTLGRLDRFGSAIASMIAPAHAEILQLFSGPPEVCAANERR